MEKDASQYLKDLEAFHVEQADLKHFSPAKQSASARFVGQERYVEQAKQALQTAPATPSIGASEATMQTWLTWGDSKQMISQCVSFEQITQFFILWMSQLDI